MEDPQETRDLVSRAYASAVSSPSVDSCCRPPVQKGTLVKRAGYTSDELDALPREAVVNSFGCGNPLAFSEVNEGDVVLDLGSGAGIDLLLAAKKVGLSGRAIGVDMTDEMIAKAREIVSASGLDNIEVRKGRIEDLPVDSGTVDWVISNCVINLSPEKAKVFSEISRVLKPGGQLSISDVVAQDLPDEVRADLGHYNCCIAGAISEEAYCDGLRQVGLAEVEIRERIEYDVTQVAKLIASDAQAFSECKCCGGGDPARPRSKGGLAEACTGKVWSAKIYARKPC